VWHLLGFWQLHNFHGSFVMLINLRKALLVGAMLLVASNAGNSFAAIARSQIDPLAQPMVDDGLAVGFVVGIVKDGKTQFFAYGETTKGSGTKPNSNTVYEIGSASKVFTGLLLADMVNAGLATLGDPLQMYLPASVKVPVAEGEPLTLKHLATHTSGLPKLPDNLSPRDWRNPYADYTMEQMHAFLSGHKLRRAPGDYEYSNFGMGLLGDVLALRQKTTYEQLVIDRIAKPLGMNDTRITLSGDQRRRLAPPYNAKLKPDKNWDFPTLAGCGGIRSTARDMVKFLQANLDKKNGPLTEAIKLSQARRQSIGSGQSIGLGWHIHVDGMTRWHNGMTGGYASWMAVVPEFNVGVVVLSNTATEKITELGLQLTSLACGNKVEPASSRKVVKVDPEVLQKYVGVFAITPQFALTVTLEDGQLKVQATGQQKLELFPESAQKFFLKVVDAQITFVPDNDGNVNKLILHQNGRDMPAARQNY
jgi:CubicO group peptidase (beta-lactamase class C family)